MNRPTALGTDLTARHNHSHGGNWKIQLISGMSIDTAHGLDLASRAIFSGPQVSWWASEFRGGASQGQDLQ